jgi:tRNA nucleotidyltransferase (CCA-adding enzyme)
VSPDLAVQFGILGRYLALDAIRSLSTRIRAANDCRDAAIAASRHADRLERAPGLGPDEWLELLTGIDALRRPDRLDTLLAVVRAYARPPKAGEPGAKSPLEETVRGAAGALASIDYSEVSKGGPNAADRVKAMRLAALRSWLENRSAQIR